MKNTTDGIEKFNEQEALLFFERARWPNGARCPYCDSKNVTLFNDSEGHRKGLHKCKLCKKQFTVTVGTRLEKTHIPLSGWYAAFSLNSPTQISRNLHITYKCAWSMFQKIQQAKKGLKEFMKSIPNTFMTEDSKEMHLLDPGILMIWSNKWKQHTIN